MLIRRFHILLQVVIGISLTCARNEVIFVNTNVALEY